MSSDDVSTTLVGLQAGQQEILAAIEKLSVQVGGSHHEPATPSNAGPSTSGAVGAQAFVPATSAADERASGQSTVATTIAPRDASSRIILTLVGFLSFPGRVVGP